MSPHPLEGTALPGPADIPLQIETRFPIPRSASTQLTASPAKLSAQSGRQGRAPAGRHPGPLWHPFSLRASSMTSQCTCGHSCCGSEPVSHPEGQRHPSFLMVFEDKMDWKMIQPTNTVNRENFMLRKIKQTHSFRHLSLRPFFFSRNLKIPLPAATGAKDPRLCLHPITVVSKNQWLTLFISNNSQFCLPCFLSPKLISQDSRGTLQPCASHLRLSFFCVRRTPLSPVAAQTPSRWQALVKGFLYARWVFGCKHNYRWEIISPITFNGLWKIIWPVRYLTCNIFSDLQAFISFPRAQQTSAGLLLTPRVLSSSPWKPNVLLSPSIESSVLQ